MFFDAHFHYPVLVQRGIADFSKLTDYKALSCAHSVEEWNIQENVQSFIYKAFGIHPQLAGIVNINEYKSFLYALAENKKLDAIGEAGFDLFTEEFKSTKDKQEDIWAFEVETAIKFNLPLVVHCRKANDLLFRDSSLLKKIPVVLFHSFMGSLVEAESLIKRGINAYFSFGKQLMNNNKKVIDCVKHLPLENLLFETDGPFQTLKGEENTVPYDIVTIYKNGYLLRNMTEDFYYFCEKLKDNSNKLLRI